MFSTKYTLGSRRVKVMSGTSACIYTLPAASDVAFFVDAVSAATSWDQVEAAYLSLLD